MPQIRKRIGALRDIDRHLDYLLDNAGIDIADKFWGNAEVSFELLAKNPMIGAPLMIPERDLGAMRKWHVKDFNNYLIFYLPLPDGISVVRVFHTAQDWWQLLCDRE